VEAVRRSSIVCLPVVPGSEEVANYLTHGGGLLLSLCAWLQLLGMTGHGTAGQQLGAAVYGGSLIVLYLASTSYHAVRHVGLKTKLRIFDHASIYLLIAGTYTPFLLALPGQWPTWGLAVVWLMAAAGVAFKVAFGFRHERLSVGMYLAMGWIGILAMGPLVDRITADGVAWLLAGGLAYTMGTMFYMRKDIKYAHAIWHIFVIAGSALHYGAIVLYVMPRTVS
jgi:hemolysin III